MGSTSSQADSTSHNQCHCWHHRLDWWLDQRRQQPVFGSIADWFAGPAFSSLHKVGVASTLRCILTMANLLTIRGRPPACLMPSHPTPHAKSTAAYVEARAAAYAAAPAAPMLLLSLLLLLLWRRRLLLLLSPMVQPASTASTALIAAL